MIRLRTLGECVAEIDDHRVGPEAERLFALLLSLGLESGRLADRGALAAMLWSEVSEERASHSLRQSIYRLRSMGAPIRTDRSRLWVEPEEIESDFAPLLFGSADPEQEAEHLGGSFLPGYNPTFSASFAEWLERQRDIINSRLRRIFLLAAGHYKSRGDWCGVELMASRCLAIDPLNEEATLARAEAAALQGGKTQAVAILDAYLKEVGPGAREIRIPATVLRRRIAESNSLGPVRAITDAPFTGREAETAELSQAMKLAAAGAGSAHIIWGEPGIGKTRLVQEISRAATLDKVPVIRVGCQSSDARRPLSMFVDLVPRLLGLPGSIGCSPAAMKKLRRLIEQDSEQESRVEDARDAAVIYAGLRRSILDLLDAITGEGMLVIVIEDIHWLDSASWDVLSDIASWLNTRRLLLMTTSREEYAERGHGISEVPRLQRHHLRPLDDAAVSELTGALMERAGGRLSTDVANWCAASCGGNPYHLTELVLHGIREGKISELPATLTQLISDRLSRLKPLSLHLLQACAVLGPHSTLERLERVLHQKRVDLLDALDELERCGLVVAEASLVQSRHELLSRAALKRLSELSRKLLHRHAALSLEEEAEPSMQWACADHWSLAGERDRALAHLRSCARHALENGIPKDAEELLERAIRLAQTSDERHEIMGEQALAHGKSGRWEKVVPLLQLRRQETPNCEPDIHDDCELVELDARWRLGASTSRFLDNLGKCISSPFADLQHRVKAALLTVISADNLFVSEAAQTAYDSVADILKDPHVDCYTRLQLESIYHASFGSLEHAEGAATEWLEHAQHLTSSQYALALRCVARIYRACGRIDESYAAFLKALRVAESSGLFYAAYWARTAMVWARLADGDAESAALVCSNIEREPPDSPALRSTLIETRALVEVCRGHPGSAEKLLAKHESAISIAQGDRPYFQLLATKVAYQNQLYGGPPMAKLKMLKAQFANARRFLGVEFGAGVLAESLAVRGEAEESREFVESYYSKYRRERYPNSAFLSRWLGEGNEIRTTSPPISDRPIAK